MPSSETLSVALISATKEQEKETIEKGKWNVHSNKKANFHSSNPKASEAIRKYLGSPGNFPG